MKKLSPSVSHAAIASLLDCQTPFDYAARAEDHFVDTLAQGTILSRPEIAVSGMLLRIELAVTVRAG